MKRFFIAAFAALWASVASAQVTVQQNATHLDAATAVAFAQAAVGSASTATITVPSGQYAYITGISIDLAQNGTSTAATNLLTTAMGNISGGPQWQFSCPATVNSNCVGVRETYAVPLKSAAPGTNVTLTATAGANNQFTVRIYYYLAP
jgi:hypothetical protein